MKVHYAPQGSPEWHAARAGCITASNFRMIRARVGGLNEQQAKYVDAIRGGMSEALAMEFAGYKSKPRSEAVEKVLAGLRVGDFSDVAKNYAFRLAIERISGVPLDEGFETWSMQRGHELEPEARVLRELRTDALVEQVGFITTDDGKFGASADGLVGDDEGDEYKCFVSPEKLRAIYLTGDTSDVIDQCDGGLWVTGRKAWNFWLYCPALKAIGLDLVGHRIERNDDRINELEQDLIAFERLVTEYELRLRAKAAGVPFDAPPAPVEAPPWADVAAAPALTPLVPLDRASARALADLPEDIFA